MLNNKKMQLINRLKDIIAVHGLNHNIKQEIGNEFRSRNMDAITASHVMMGNMDLNTLSDSEKDIRFLFILAYALNKAIPDINLSLEEYFTKAEIDKWTDYKAEEAPKNMYPIIIENVYPLGDRIWQGTISAQQLNQLHESNVLIYNFKTQRNPKITIAGEKINIDREKILEIKNRLISNEQFPDSIKINILRNGNDKYSYNEKTKTLSIFEGSVINIFDGYHRTCANSLALEKNPELSFTWSIIIVNFSEKQAHDYMVQIDKQKPINKEYIKNFDYDLPENRVVDFILDDPNSELGRVTKTDDAHIRLNLALTKRSILAQAIKENYAEMLGLSVNTTIIGRWIIEFTNYLMGLYVDEFIINPYEVKKTSYINDKNMFYGYIALSAVLYNKKNWKELLKQKMESIDFSRTNALWQQIGLHVDNRDINLATRKKLYSLMKEGV